MATILQSVASYAKSRSSPMRTSRNPIFDASFGEGTDASGRAVLYRHRAASAFFVDAIDGRSEYNGLSPFPGMRPDGSTPDETYGPKQTIAQAVALVVNARGDWVLIRAGQNHTGAWDKSASSQSLRNKRGRQSEGMRYPVVFQSYDGSDPLNEAQYGRLIATVCTDFESGPNRYMAAQGAGDRPAEETESGGRPGNGYAINGPWAFRGLHFKPLPPTIPADSGSAHPARLSFTGGFTGILFENCRFDHTHLTFSTVVGVSVAVVRRCCFFACPPAFYASFASMTRKPRAWVVEDTLNYHGGWFYGQTRDAVVDFTLPPGRRENANIYNHNFYFGEGWYDSHRAAPANEAKDTGGGGDLIYRRNISAHASSHGLQARSGGMITDSVFIRNPIACVIGGGSDPSQCVRGGVHAEFIGNFILGAQDINRSNPRGSGLDMCNLRRGSRVSNNIIANVGPYASANIASRQLFAFDSYPTDVALDNNIVYRWGRIPLQVLRGAAFRPDLVTYSETDSELDEPRHGSNVDSATVRYPSPSRNLLSYFDTLGHRYQGRNELEREASCLETMCGDWTNPAYSADALRSYLFAGFGRRVDGIR
jgi:hypothetical protein